VKACVDHSWPRNLEELETFVKCYLVAGDKEIVFSSRETDTGRHGSISSQILGLPTDLTQEIESSTSGAKSLKSLIQSVKSETERNAIAVALEKTAWNRKAAARLLKLSYRTLLYKIEQYHMNTSELYSPPFAGGGSGHRRNGKAS